MTASTPLFIQPEPELPLDLAAAVPAADPFDQSSEHCDICGEDITGTAAGRSSAKFKLGTHRWVKHGLKSDKKKARAGAKSVDPEGYIEQPISTGLRDIAESIGDNRRVPTANDLAKGLGKGLAMTTTAAAVYAVETDQAIPEGAQGQEQRNFLVGYLSLKERAAADVMMPIARMIAPTGLNKKYGRQIVDNVDVVASFSELGAMAMHWRNYLRARAIMNRPPEAAPPATLGGGNVAAGAPLFAVPDIAPPPVNAEGGYNGGATSPPPMSGVLYVPPAPPA